MLRTKAGLYCEKKLIYYFGKQVSLQEAHAWSTDGDESWVAIKDNKS